jgi:hypothetical protein
MPVATEDALAGLGVPAQLSALLGAQPAVLTCAGTSQTTAAVLKSRGSELTAAASQTGAIPPFDAPIMTPYALTNSSSTTVVLYVPVGHNLNSSLNGSVNVAQNKSIYLWQYKAKYWTYILTA